MTDQAKMPGEIRDLYFSETDSRSAAVNIGPAARAVIRDFLTQVDENLTVADVIAALEGEWS